MCLCMSTNCQPLCVFPLMHPPVQLHFSRPLVMQRCLMLPFSQQYLTPTQIYSREMVYRLGRMSMDYKYYVVMCGCFSKPGQ